MKTKKRLRRKDEDIANDRQRLFNYLLINRDKKITKDDIIKQIYSPQEYEFVDRTIQLDLKAVGVSCEQKKYYSLKRIRDLEKCILSLHETLKYITIYSPLLEAKAIKIKEVYPKTEQIDLFIIIVTSSDIKFLLEFQVHLKNYIEYLNYTIDDIIFETQSSSTILKFYFTSKELCESFFDLLYYAKFESKDTLIYDPEIKTFLSKDLVRELQRGTNFHKK